MMDWDAYFQPLVYNIAAKSKDRSSKYGAIITDVSRRILSTGYNGIPRGLEYREDYHSRPDKYMYFVHAEQNAIYAAAANGVAVEGGCIYLIKPPCAECVKGIIQAGIGEVIYYEQHSEMDTTQMLDVDVWRATLEAAANMLRLTGTTIRLAVTLNSAPQYQP
jgi:dCMP deaminase